MHNHAGVYRTEQLLKAGCEKITDIAAHMDENLLVRPSPSLFVFPSLSNPLTDKLTVG